MSSVMPYQWYSYEGVTHLDTGGTSDGATMSCLIILDGTLSWVSRHGDDVPYTPTVLDILSFREAIGGALPGGFSPAIWPGQLILIDVLAYLEGLTC